MSETVQGQEELRDFFDRKATITRHVRSLAELARSIGATTLADNLDTGLVHKLEADGFNLVVVGEFNHGKSTFVNALIGDKLLPTGVTPTTAVIHKILHADTAQATLVRSSGEREPLEVESLARWAANSPTTKLSSVDHIEVKWPAPLLADRITLVDTPGVNDLSLQRADITYGYIPEADAVLFLLDSGQLIKESERVFLRDKLLAASRDKIIFVITKWDLLDKAEQEEAFEYATKRLAELVDSPTIFAVSATRHLPKSDQPSGIEDVLEHLRSYLASARGRIILENATTDALAVVGLLEKGLAAAKRARQMELSELVRRIDTLERDLESRSSTLEERRTVIREEIRGIKVGAQKDLSHFASTLVAKLPGVIESAKADDIKTYLPAFLEDTFRDWASAESKEIAEALETLTEKTVALVRDDAESAARDVARTLSGSEPARLDVQVDTFRYDVGVAALFTVGLSVMFANALLGGLLALGAPILALVLKDRVDAEIKKRAMERAPKVVSELCDHVGPKLDAMIDDFGAKLDAWVVSATEDLYREVLEVLRRERDHRATLTEDAERSDSELEARMQTLGELRTELETAREGALAIEGVSGEHPIAAPA